LIYFFFFFCRKLRPRDEDSQPPPNNMPSAIKAERRMTKEAFIRNEILIAIYDRIQKNQISLKEDDAAREKN
jgi:hypothetical protein